MIKLTSPNPKFDAMRAETHIGQAHWAGTGPTGKTCRDCLFWDHRNQRKTDGTLKPARCKRYQQLANEPGKPVPHFAKACRQFTPADSVPRIAEKVA